MWTVLTWLFVPALALIYGVSGAAFGFSLVGASSIIAMILALRYIEINYLEIIGKPAVATVTTGGVVFLIRSVVSTSLLQVVLMAMGALIVYALTVFIIEPKILFYLKLRKQNV